MATKPHFLWKYMVTDYIKEGKLANLSWLSNKTDLSLHL